MARVKKVVLVSKESLKKMLDEADRPKQIRIVGRALVAIFQRQTESERNHNSADVNNTIGFSGPDAKSGSLTAKSYLAHGTLQDWQLDRWIRIDRTGFPRICKYHSQLNEIAIAKQEGF